MEKLTKSQKFAKIATLLANDPEIVNFCNHEIELLAKKNTKATAKAAEAADPIKQEIINVLIDAEEPLTAAQIIAANPVLGQYTTQKISALITSLKNAGMIERTEIKRKAYYTLK